jgi:hypothetical protein
MTEAIILTLNTGSSNDCFVLWQAGLGLFTGSASPRHPPTYLARICPSPKSSPSALTAPESPPLSCQMIASKSKGSTWIFAASTRIVRSTAGDRCGTTNAKTAASFHIRRPLADVMIAIERRAILDERLHRALPLGKQPKARPAKRSTTRMRKRSKAAKTSLDVRLRHNT